jgi:hypothetical protein
VLDIRIPLTLALSRKGRENNTQQAREKIIAKFFNDASTAIRFLGLIETNP